MPHPLVDQLRFARGEFVRCLEGVSEEDGRRRLEPMNCISWMIGHLSTQENFYWVLQAQGQELYPDLYRLVGWGSSASTPSLNEMWETWRSITTAADAYLETLDSTILQTYLEREGEPRDENVGTKLLRSIYHYWFHLGEAHAVRQMLGHTDLPQFVGDMSRAVYRPKSQL